MHRGGDGFFRDGRWRSGDELTDRVFEVAYFWRASPATVLALTLPEYLLWERQAERLAEKMQPNDE